MHSDVRLRPKADIRRSARSAPRWVRLYIGLLAGPRHSKIGSYQGDSPPTVSCDTSYSLARSGSQVI